MAGAKRAASAGARREAEVESNAMTGAERDAGSAAFHPELETRLAATPGARREAEAGSTGTRLDAIGRTATCHVDGAAQRACCGGRPHPRWPAVLALVPGVAMLAPAAAHAAPAPAVIARCGDSAIDVTPGPEGGTATLHGVVVGAGGDRWSFTASVGMARLGAKTRTITVESLTTVEGAPARGKRAAPSALFIDLLLDDKKLVLRHASEGGGDPDYAVDLDRCSFAREADGALAALVPPPAEPAGCAPDTVRGSYRTQIARVAKLSDTDAEREARALCEDHQKTIEARTRLEQAISDRAARDRLAARGAAVRKTEDARIQAWNRLDGCLGSEPANARQVAALHDAEARTRACYAKIAPRP